jgi:hypothetical protein
MTIMAGWRTAVAIARAALEKATVDHSSDAKVPYPHPHPHLLYVLFRAPWLHLCPLLVETVSILLSHFTSHKYLQPLRHYGSLVVPLERPGV